MKKLFCFLLLFVSLSVSALDGHFEGECGFRTRDDEFLGLCGKVRIVGKGEIADINVHIWKPGDILPEHTPELFVRVLKSAPSFYSCGDFLVVKSGENFTVKLVDDTEQADIVIRLGNRPKDSRDFWYSN